MSVYPDISYHMVYVIILQPISQASREKIRPAAETIAAEREPIAAEREPIAAEREPIAAERELIASRSLHFVACVAGPI